MFQDTREELGAWGYDRRGEVDRRSREVGRNGKPIVELVRKVSERRGLGLGGS